VTSDGALLGDRYRLGILLGRGGMAEVRRAWDTRLQRPVAIKLFQSIEDDVARRRFDEEAKTLASLSHPGLVTVYDTGTTSDGTPFLILHLVDGQTLRARISEGPMSPADVRAIGAQLADTLAHVHEQGIVHRDVKPSNILLDEENMPFLADFGIARPLDATSLTTTGEVVGTAGYLAPEQVLGDEIGCPVDIYALGLVLLECLTGYREYDGTDVEAALARLNRPIHVPDHVPPNLGTVLRMMTSLTPRRRPTAARCAQLLREPDQIALAEKPTLRGDPVPMPAVAEELIPAPRRRRGRMFAAAGVLAAAGVTAIVLANTAEPDDSTPTNSITPPQTSSSTSTSTSTTAPVTAPASQSPVAQVTVTSTVVKQAPPAQQQVRTGSNKGKEKGPPPKKGGPGPGV
jgi:serine/threonine protein kinase